MIDKENLMYEIIHNTDCNVPPYIQTLGSVLFKFIKKVNKDLYILEPLKTKEYIKDYNLYSEENMCRTYQWLKDNNLIYYSSSLLKYCLTDKAKELLEL